jgi:HPt (histidine-containing phosphotransfer) domain-containing protein
MTKAAHALKGAAANLYAATLRDQSADVESSAAKFSRAELDTRIAAIAHECERVCVALHGLATTAASSAAAG